MINIKKLIQPPKDFFDMVARKGKDDKFHISGIVINKKSTKGYNVEIEMDTEHLTPDSNLKVSCTCDDFKFRWAYVLYEQDALLNPKTFVLEPPKKTNPKGNTNACKHIHTFMKTELDNSLKSFAKSKNRI